jgi:hypothetical protein
MVSKASDDLPEPDRPVNTTSLSRGISTSMFLRLCSRAPRMVIARMLLALCWRFALITSSISAFPDRQVQARRMRCVRARIAGDLRSNAKWVSSEHRKNGNRFPVPRAIHQRIVAKHRMFKGSGNRWCEETAQEISMAADGSSLTTRPAKRPA